MYACLISHYSHARARARIIDENYGTRVSDNSRGGTLLNNKKIQMRTIAVHEIQKIAEIKSCSTEKRKKRDRGRGANVTLLLESIIRRQLARR